MNLFLFRDKNSGMYLGIDSVEHKWDLFYMPGERNRIQTLEIGYSRKDSAKWLSWLLNVAQSKTSYLLSKDLQESLDNGEVVLEVVEYMELAEKTVREVIPIPADYDGSE